MNISGIVHSCSEQQLPVQAEYEGKPITAYKAGLVIEIVGATRSWTFDYIPASDDDLAAQKKIFTVGATVTSGDFTQEA